MLGGLYGTLTNDGVRSYTYDAVSRLTAVSGLPSHREASPSAVGYTYNGDGLLVGQNIGGVSTTFTWDVAAGPSAALRTRLPQVLATSNGASYLYGLGLLAQQQGSAWQYPLADGLGSVRQLTDPQGQPLTSYRFDPFGVPLSASGGQPFGYAGSSLP